MNRLLNLLISPVVMAIILVIGIIAMASATFIENDFGAQVAKQAVYNARWFEILLLLFTVNLIGSIFKRKLYRKQKFSIFLFHIAFIVMILGAGFTRYVGYEGSMHIREGKSSSTLLTQNKSLTLNLKKDGVSKQFNWPENKVLRKSGFSDNFKFEHEKFTVSLKSFYPNAIEKAIPVEGGQTTIGFIMAGKSYRGFSYITKGETITIGNKLVSFDDKNEDADFYFTLQNDTLYLGGKLPVIESEMDASAKVLMHENGIAVQLKKLYNTGLYNIVVQEIIPEAIIAAFPNSDANSRSGKPAYVFTVGNNEKSQNLTLWGGNESEANTVLEFNNISLTAHYGNQIIQLPFELYLDDFEVERYPGSKSPSSFSSYVHILEPNKEPQPFHIYMNNILQMEGYRFYQSSYDRDEKGTILSVNYDSLGTNVTYFGYFLLFLGIILSMVNKNSFLRKTIIPKNTLPILVFALVSILGSTTLVAQNNTSKKYISQEHAEKFGELLIQDNKGRTEPVYTFASDLMRKLSRKEKMFDLTPVQIFMEMNMNYEYWMNMPLIKISNRELQKYLGLKSNYASYNDFISRGNTYKLQGKVEQAYNTPPGKQSKFDKAIIKADERMNICYAIFSGNYLKMFPLADSEDHQWHASHETALMTKNSKDSLFLANILPVYFQELEKATITGNYKLADEYLTGIGQYQQKNAGYELPSDFKINLEVKYYKWNVFKKLFPFYTIFGAIFLFVLIGGIISGKGVSKKISNSFFAIILAGFVVHFIGLAVRWFISGHAPMSNGYESLVFISLITLLAGLIFSKQSMLALSATAVLAGFTLMVANLSFMDPEITNLVPVLKSYWLTIHVSVITGSYGFLGLGAILGIINLVLTIIQNKKNHGRIEETIASLTVINHRTLILGLYFLTIGTFLGAVWANESWGRYWGWDPKETWSLITMIIYTFVTHARMVPGLKGAFAFNTLSVYAFFSVLMTYFGVNYYLSGLHSYAAGDPVPVPTFVYVSVALIITLTIVAYIRFMKNHLKE